MKHIENLKFTCFSYQENQDRLQQEGEILSNGKKQEKELNYIRENN